MNKTARAKKGNVRRVIVHTPEPGAGAGQYVAELVKALAAAGERIVLFCPSNFASEREVAAGGVEIVHAPLREVKHASLGRRVLPKSGIHLGGIAEILGLGDERRHRPFSIRPAFKFEPAVLSCRAHERSLSGPYRT
jgi:hypothetical protein